ncbi:hypothetical protein COCON_G00156570 [Conger conger]|uniref:Nucleoplasmin core domain-containing protein n=1 Tax=Conger conger TaxID=82655 RepID=A0A9Q1HUV8_CONCO|nr:hypothetical protein COCON_G00156570 [Conger conger]
MKGDPGEEGDFPSLQRTCSSATEKQVPAHRTEHRFPSPAGRLGHAVAFGKGAGTQWSNLQPDYALPQSDFNEPFYDGVWEAAPQAGPAQTPGFLINIFSPHTKSPVMLASDCFGVEDVAYLPETMMYSLNASLASSGIETVCALWGCELGAMKRTAVFEVEDDLLEHQFFIRTICLSAEANEEMHVVEVQDKMVGRSHPVPIATLRPHCLPMVSFSGFELMPPVTFNLRSGLGPVFICGQHVTLDMDEDEEEAVFSKTSSPYTGRRR